MSQDIYISEWLEKDYKVVYAQLCSVLAELQITPKTLPYSNEVWCRDYMPVHVGKGGTLVSISDQTTFGTNHQIADT